MLRLISDYNKQLVFADKNDAMVGNYGCVRKNAQQMRFSISLKKQCLFHFFYIRW